MEEIENVLLGFCVSIQNPTNDRKVIMIRTNKNNTRYPYPFKSEVKITGFGDFPLFIFILVMVQGEEAKEFMEITEIAQQLQEATGNARLD